MPTPCLQNSKLYSSKLQIKVTDPNIITIMVKNKANNNPLLPKIIRDKLWLTVSLQGCSHIIQRKSNTMKSQHDQMLMFYHGQEPRHPIQIKLLCDGASFYLYMCDSTQSAVASESKDQSSTSILTLKSTLTLDLNAFRTWREKQWKIHY